MKRWRACSWSAAPSPDQPQDGGFTPLHAAAANGLTALCDFLIEHGANPTALTQDVLTPADLAERAGRAELAAPSSPRTSGR